MRKELIFPTELKNKAVTVQVSGLVDQNKRYIIGVRVDRIIDEKTGNFLDLREVPIDKLHSFMEIGEKMLEENNFAHKN